VKKLAIFASGRGSNFDNIAKRIKRRKIRAELTVLFSDQPKAGALKLAKKHGVRSFVLERSDYPTKQAYEQAVVKELKRAKIDYIILAGYMRILGDVLIKAYGGKILNVHPALLPAFKGAHGIKDAYDYGVRIAGVTVHFVDAEVDHGPIVSQKAVEIRAGESLAGFEKRIHLAEHEIFPKAIALLVAGRLKLKGRKVVISGAPNKARATKVKS